MDHVHDGEVDNDKYDPVRPLHRSRAATPLRHSRPPGSSSYVELAPHSKRRSGELIVEGQYAIGVHVTLRTKNSGRLDCDAGLSGGGLSSGDLRTS